MAQAQINPTRMELKKLQTKYTTARRGHKLLKDKRDELMRRFLEVVREDKEIRARVEKRLAGAYASFSVAAAISSPKMLSEALICPKREAEITVSYKNAMGVTVPTFDMDLRASTTSGGVNYGFAFTSGELDSSVIELSEILEDMLRMVELEKTAQLLAEEIEKTRRRVNALEYILMPQYLASIRTIKMKLDENERGNTTRLMKVKDMMIKAQLPIRDSEDTDGSDPSADA